MHTINRAPLHEYVLGFVVSAVLVFSLFLISSRKPTIGNRSSDKVLGFDPPAFNVGTVMQSEIVRHDFRLVNRGTNEVRIIGLDSSCSCTVISEKLLGKVIQPQGYIIVPVEYNSGLREGRASAIVTAVLKASGTKFRYTVEAQLNLDIQSEFSIDPRSIDFGALRPGASATRTIVIRAGASKQLRVLRTYSTHQAFDVSLLETELRDSTQAPIRASVTFHAPKSAQRETLSGVVEFATTSARVPTATIGVRGQVLPDVYISPDVVVLTANGASEASTITVSTEYPSRILRVIAKAPDGNKVINMIEDSTGIGQSSEWLREHICTVSNKVMVGANRIDFELQVRNGTDPEARSVSVHVKSL